MVQTLKLNIDQLNNKSISRAVFLDNQAGNIMLRNNLGQIENSLIPQIKTLEDEVEETSVQKSGLGNTINHILNGYGKIVEETFKDQIPDISRIEIENSIKDNYPNLMRAYRFYNNNQYN